MTYFLADNIISSLGFTSEENLSAMMRGEIGICEREDHHIYPTPFPASLIDSGLIGQKFGTLNSNWKYTRLEKLMILSVRNAIEKVNFDVKSKRTIFILSTTKGNIDLLEPEKKGQWEKNRVELWKLGQIVSHNFGNTNQPVVLSNACISGVLGINIGAALINSGQYDHAVVVGGDIVSRFVVSGFMSFLSLSPNPCKPFDKNRDGLSLGEAAGTVILGRSKGEEKPIAWLGGATANDANHISGPSRTGEGSYISIEKALNEAQLSSEQIEHISAHGTATPYNDEMESISISRHGMDSVPVNSMKGYWGHTLGAAGIIETAMLLQEMRSNTLLKTAGFSEIGVTKPINVVKENQQKEFSTGLKLASGFGGSNAAMIIQKV